MEIKLTKDGDAAMLSLAGEFEEQDAPKFSEALSELGETADLVLDLDGLEFLSTAGLGAIVRAQKRTEGKGSFALVGVSPTLADLFRMTGLYGRMDIYEKD